jgi:hypothetical protein
MLTTRRNNSSGRPVYSVGIVMWAEARRALQFVVIAGVLYAGWVFGSRYFSGGYWSTLKARKAAEQQAAFDRTYGGTAVKILQFYARDGALTEGSGSVICYGVLNAKSVRIEPPVEGVFPALNRCVAVQPQHQTRYTLTAEGKDGRTVSESFVLAVRADEATLPKVTSFKVQNRELDYRGRPVYLVSFGAQNAETVDIDPQAFPTLHGAPNGRFYVSPEKTTTYTLTVTGKHGHKAQQKLTLQVP